MIVDILGSINQMLAKLFYLAVSVGIGILIVLLAPVLAIVLPIYFLHSGDQENVQLLMKAYILIGPIAAAFWFSVVAKSREERKERNGIGGAAARVFLGLVLSFVGTALIGFHMYHNDATAVCESDSNCTVSYLATRPTSAHQYSDPKGDIWDATGLRSMPDGGDTKGWEQYSRAKEKRYAMAVKRVRYSSDIVWLAKALPSNTPMNAIWFLEMFCGITAPVLLLLVHRIFKVFCGITAPVLLLLVHRIFKGTKPSLELDRPVQYGENGVSKDVLAIFAEQGLRYDAATGRAVPIT